MITIKNAMMKYHASNFFLCLIPALLLICCNAKSPGAEQGIGDSSNLVAAQQYAGVITIPPASWRLDSFYNKYLNVSGIPVVSSEKVPDAAFFAVEKMMTKMLSMRPDI